MSRSERPPPPPEPLTSDPIHAPLEHSEVSVPAPPVESGSLGGNEPSWTGPRLEGDRSSFEPGVESVDADTWGEATEIGIDPEEKQAESMLQRGELGEALRLYQEIAIRRPDEPHLWERVAEIALMLQERSKT
jgi:hypothetical protein